MVSSRKRASHKPLRTKSSDPSPKTLPGKMPSKTSASSIGQLHGRRLHQQTRGGGGGGGGAHTQQNSMP